MGITHLETLYCPPLTHTRTHTHTRTAHFPLWPKYHDSELINILLHLHFYVQIKNLNENSKIQEYFFYEINDSIPEKIFIFTQF